MKVKEPGSSGIPEAVIKERKTIMKKLYEKNEIIFAVLWILAYCIAMTPVKGQFGYGSIWMLLVLVLFAAGITAFVKTNRLTEKYGLSGFPADMKKFLFFIPMFILATGNLWDGFSLSYRGMPLLLATLYMILVGYVEEMIFRGFLFKAMLGNGKTVPAIVVSALTFGIGHIVNLFAGQASFETVIQVIFAISWGFILTMVFYKSGSLIPCIIAHAMVDVFSLYGADNELTDQIYIGVTILVAVLYCIYLGRLKSSTQ
ncbi:MAG: CPBP family intramembrane metalloprotease [Lachnospiraceae bacterium]|nr:CPBP family intramembrane metalloprotease [Lachnospiraceae bacterium]